MRAEARSRDLSRSHGGDSITKEAARAWEHTWPRETVARPARTRLSQKMRIGGTLFATTSTARTGYEVMYQLATGPSREPVSENAPSVNLVVCERLFVRQSSNKRPFLVMRKTYRPPTPSKDNPSPPRAPHPPTAWRGVPESYGNGTESPQRPRTLLRPYSLHRMRSGRALRACA